MLLAQQPIGGFRCRATGKGNLNPVLFRQGQVDDLGDRLGSPLGQAAAIGQLDQLVLAHCSHSVWKVPSRSTRS